jgi:hypothetical protein
MKIAIFTKTKISLKAFNIYLVMQYLRTLIFFIIIFATLIVNAQNSGFDYYDPAFSNPVDELTTPEIKMKRQPQIRLLTGTGFGTSFNRTSSFSTFFAPVVSYPISDRFNINAGVVIMNTRITSGIEKMGNFNMNGRSLFAGFDYRLSDNVSIGGSIQMNQGLSPFHSPFASPGIMRTGSPMMGW